MREYCLITEAGSVVNMCKCYGDREPTLTDFHVSQGWRWVPINKVPQSALTRYRFWNERP